METIKLEIPNMKSAHCQMTVSNVVRSIGGSVKSIAPTRAEVELVGNLTKESVVHAIQKAGYDVSKGTN